MRGLVVREVIEDNEARRIEDCAAASRLDRSLLRDLPRNAELHATLAKGRKPALHVFAKSLAAWEGLAQAGAQRQGGLGSAAEYVRRKSAEAGKTPCFFALLLPGASRQALGGFSLEQGKSQAYLCTPPSGKGAWMDASPAPKGWHAWLCATPMDMEQRCAWCASRLDQSKALRAWNSVMYESAFAEEIGMPAAIVHELLAKVCEAEASAFAHLRTSGGQCYIKRVKAR